MAEQDVPETPEEAIKELFLSMNKGQYLLACEAIRQLGGEMRVDWDTLASAARQELPSLYIDGTDGPVVVRIQ